MEEKNKGLRRRKYDAAFKADVLKMVSSGQSVAYVSRALGVSETIIYRWRQKREGEIRRESKPILLPCRPRMSSYGSGCGNGTF
jgi:transposase-like protein